MRLLFLAGQIASLAACTSPVPLAPPQPSVYHTAALGAGEWLLSQAVDTPYGKAWPADPHTPENIGTHLYDGVPGVVLYFLEAYRHGEARFCKLMLGLDEGRGVVSNLHKKIRKSVGPIPMPTIRRMMKSTAKSVTVLAESDLPPAWD